MELVYVALLRQESICGYMTDKFDKIEPSGARKLGMLRMSLVDNTVVAFERPGYPTVLIPSVQVRMFITRKDYEQYLELLKAAAACEVPATPAPVVVNVEAPPPQKQEPRELLTDFVADGTMTDEEAKSLRAAMHRAKARKK